MSAPAFQVQSATKLSNGTFRSFPAGIVSFPSIGALPRRASVAPAEAASSRGPPADATEKGAASTEACVSRSEHGPVDLRLETDAAAELHVVGKLSGDPGQPGDVVDFHLAGSSDTQLDARLPLLRLAEPVDAAVEHPEGGCPRTSSVSVIASAPDGQSRDESVRAVGARPSSSSRRGKSVARPTTTSVPSGAPVGVAARARKDPDRATRRRFDVGRKARDREVLRREGRLQRRAAHGLPRRRRRTERSRQRQVAAGVRQKSRGELEPRGRRGAHVRDAALHILDRRRDRLPGHDLAVDEDGAPADDVDARHEQGRRRGLRRGRALAPAGGKEIGDVERSLGVALDGQHRFAQHDLLHLDAPREERPEGDPHGDFVGGQQRRALPARLVVDDELLDSGAEAREDLQAHLADVDLAMQRVLGFFHDPRAHRIERHEVRKREEGEQQHADEDARRSRAGGARRGA